MNNFQKVIKILAICLAIFLIINICVLVFSGITLFTHLDSNNNNNGKEFTQTYNNVKKIDIDILSSNIEIKPGQEFKVEANTESKLTCTQNNEILKIEENVGWFKVNKVSGNIIIYIPKEANIEKLDLDTGAGKIDIQNIKAEKIDLDHGAGVLKITDSKFDNTDIDGGAGKIEIASSELNNMDLDCGAGKVEIEARITGNNKISAGVGEINLELLGNKEEYQITAERGIGNIRIENQECSSKTTYGIGTNKIKVEGGIGNIDIQYINK